ncbi:hypothetical protein D5S18_21310 [Nocardia panacis]|uniref:Uncharacterized protein n=1 Tax=Nocardia panacis TaxID=2340916 RepID=A0A3A4K839_9NOCA|nr:hypothetical protein [Nocardia panacis]RJO73712.1 hypothetical protein D5S18_21310 [Nocardia panacis]
MLANAHLAVAAAIAGGLPALFSLGSSAVVAAAAIDADVLATISAIQASYRASQMVKVLGMTGLALGAVGVIDAFHALPAIDLDKAIARLAAIIAMKAAIDDASDLGESDKPDSRIPRIASRNTSPTGIWTRPGGN